MREAVKIFAEAMEKKLQEHDDNRGEEGWLNHSTTVDYLFNRLEEEIAELRDTLNEIQPKFAMQECIDVSNFAMMIRNRIWNNNR